MKLSPAKRAQGARRAGASLLLLGSLASGAYGSQPPSPSPSPSPSTRLLAQRLSDLPGLENVGQVAPGLYRGGVPSEAGLDTLKKMGVRTVVNLRHYHWKGEEKACRARDLAYVRIGTESSDAPSDEDIARFLKIATDPERQPVYFHCWRGKDRTGVFCASYRMAVDGWPLEDALQEMEVYGFFRGWRDLRDYVVGFPDRRDRVWTRGETLPR